MVWISKLDIENVRAVRKAVLEPNPGLNFVVGNNGAGKTSVLEAIYLGARGRSFRHPDAGPLITRGEDLCRVVMRLDALVSRSGAAVLGVERDKRDIRCRFEGRDISRRSELAEILPCLFMGSQPQLLLSEGPELRRRFLDLVVFHVEHEYVSMIRSFGHALRQRNAALKQGDVEQARTWTAPFAKVSQRLTETRNRIADSVVSRCREILDDWETGFTIEGHFRPGWRQGSDLESALLERLDDDLQRGFTGLGPQRADIEFIQGGGLAEKRLSRGQQKILVAALNLAILDIVSGERGETWRPIMLIDDLGSELDVQNQERIITDLCRRGIQAFVAMISIEATLGVAESAVKVFHVEHGAIK